jgi:hypothetical protein
MKNTVIMAAVLVSAGAAADQPGVLKPHDTYEAQIRFNNGTMSTLTVNAINGLIARQIAQAQCGGLTNCTVTRVTPK